MKVNKKKILWYTLFIIFLIAIFFFFKSIKEIIKIILLSFVFAYVLFPIRDYLMKKINIKAKTASLIIILCITIIITAGLINLVPGLFDEILNLGNIINNITKYAEKLFSKFKLSGIPIFDEVYNSLVEKGNKIISVISDKALESVIKYSNEFLAYAVVPVIMYYFLSDGKTLYNKALLIICAEKRILIKKIISNIDRVLSRYIAGQFYLSIIISIISFFIYFIFKVKFLIWLSILNGVFNIIPYFGPVFGAAPAIVIAFMDSTTKGIYVTISLILLQQIEGNILSPAIIGKSIDMHPFVIIILLLIGETVGGFLGMIFIIPLAVIVKVIYNDINYYLF